VPRTPPPTHPTPTPREIVGASQRVPISYARALGEARTGNITGAQKEIAQLQSLKDQLSAA
jgi:hypothetical protein